MKIVINKCFGGFGLSQEAVEWLMKNKNWKAVKENSKEDGKIIEWVEPNSIKCFGKYTASTYNIERTDKDLIEVVEILGSKANSRYANLKVVEIPDGIEYEIDEYDGVESIHEKHEVWG